MVHTFYICMRYQYTSQSVSDKSDTLVYSIYVERTLVSCVNNNLENSPSNNSKIFFFNQFELIEIDLRQTMTYAIAIIDVVSAVEVEPIPYLLEYFGSLSVVLGK